MIFRVAFLYSQNTDGLYSSGVIAIDSSSFEALTSSVGGEQPIKSKQADNSINKRFIKLLLPVLIAFVAFFTTSIRVTVVVPFVVVITKTVTRLYVFVFRACIVVRPFYVVGIVRLRAHVTISAARFLLSLCFVIVRHIFPFRGKSVQTPAPVFIEYYPL